MAGPRRPTSAGRANAPTTLPSPIETPNHRLVVRVQRSPYLVDFLAALLVPDLGKSIHGNLLILPAIAEAAMVPYLLIKGCEDCENLKCAEADPGCRIGATHA